MEITYEGIVVGDFQDGLGTHGNLSGFFVQEEDMMPILILYSKEFLYMTEELCN
jgi:predicted extracellular nuclease